MNGWNCGERFWSSECMWMEKRENTLPIEVLEPLALFELQMQWKGFDIE
jgi:hypothetical protein